MENKVFGYARVSTKEQNEQRQIDALLTHVTSDRDIFIDKQSGKDFCREKYMAMKNSLRSGDTVIVQSIDRLGRNYNEILQEWRVITKELHCHIAVLDMPLLDTRTQPEDGLTGQFIADLVLHILAYVAQNERENIRKRQRDGIDAAKRHGKRLGRPKIERPLEFGSVYRQWANKAITGVEAMRRLGLKPNTFYRFVSEYISETKDL